MYVILMILVYFLRKFVIIFTDFLQPGYVSLKRIRIRLTQMKRIQTDPDPQHWFQRHLNVMNAVGAISVGTSMQTRKG